jgi:hypothetical protein
MSLLTVVVTLLIVGVLLFCVNAYGGQVIDGKILKIINIVVVIACLLWLLSVFGLFESIGNVQVPRLHG